MRKWSYFLSDVIYLQHNFFSWVHSCVLHVLRFHHTLHTEICLDATGRHNRSHQVQTWARSARLPASTWWIYLAAKHQLYVTPAQISPPRPVPQYRGKTNKQLLNKIGKTSFLRPASSHADRATLAPAQSFSADPPPRFPPPLQSK